MCRCIVRVIASDCGHPLSEDVHTCSQAVDTGHPCDPDESDTRMEIRDVPGKCNNCRQSDIERMEQAETETVLQNSSDTWSQVHDFETEYEVILRRTGEEAEELAHNMHEEETERALEISRIDFEQQQNSSDPDADYEAQVAQATAASLADYARHRDDDDDDNDNDDFKRIINDSILTYEQEQGPANLNADYEAAVARSMADIPDYDVQYAQDIEIALATSQTDALQSQHEDHEAVVHRLLQQTSLEHEQQQQSMRQHGVLADDDPRLQEVFDLSVNDWHKCTWDQSPPPPDTEPGKKSKKKGKKALRTPTPPTTNENASMNDITRDMSAMNMNINVQARAQAHAAANAHANANAENRTPSPPQLQLQPGQAVPRWGSPPPQYSPTEAGPSNSSGSRDYTSRLSGHDDVDDDEKLDDAEFLKKKRVAFLRRFEGSRGVGEQSGGL